MSNEKHGTNNGAKHNHPTVRTYILIAIVLAIITYIEYYIVEFPTFLSTGGILFWLYALSIVKFLLVIMFFMHLKYDSPMLTGLFTSGLIIGAGTLGALMLLFFFFQDDTAALEAQAGVVTATMEPTVPHDERVEPVIAFDWGAGEQVYNANCASCHLARGEGVPGAFPPLAVHAPAIVLADGGRDYMLDVLLYGLQGPIEVLGNTYNGVMPPWPQLSNEQIRDVSNYIIAAWGNAQLLPEGYEPFSAEEVEAQRGLNLSPTDVHARRQALDIQLVEPGVTLEDATAEDVNLIGEQERVIGEPPPREDLAAPAAPALAATWNWQDLGAQVYGLNCASCHQQGGQGVPGAFPPLAGHAADLYRAEGGREYLIHVMLYGLQGAIEVEGQTYNGIMPAWAQLESEQIAAVINHMVTAWGNDALLPPDWDDLTASEIDAERNLNLSMTDVHEARQRLVFTAAPAAPEEPSVEAAPAEEIVAAPIEVPGEVTGGVYTLSLSPEELQDSNSITITLTDVDGNTYTTTLELPRGMQDVAVLAGPEGAVVGATVVAEPIEVPAEVVAEPIEEPIELVEEPAEIVAEPLEPVVEEPVVEEPVVEEPAPTPAEDLTHVLRLALDEGNNVLVITLEDDEGNRYVTSAPFTGALGEIAVTTNDEQREPPFLNLRHEDDTLTLLFEDSEGNRYLTSVPFVASLANVALALGEAEVAAEVAELVTPTVAPEERAYALSLALEDETLVITLEDQLGNQHMTSVPFVGELAELTVVTEDAPATPPYLSLSSDDEALTVRFESAQGDLYETTVPFVGTVAELELALGDAQLAPSELVAEPLEPPVEVVDDPFAPLPEEVVEEEVVEEPAPIVIIAEPLVREPVAEPEPLVVEEPAPVVVEEPEPVIEEPEPLAVEEPEVAEEPAPVLEEPVALEEPEVIIEEPAVLEPVQPVAAAITVPAEVAQPAPAPAQVAEVEAVFERLFFDWDWQEVGAGVYSLNCVTCHQPGGQGLGRIFPPLAGHVPSLYQADGGRDYLVNLILYGLQGEITVLGQPYNNIMPPWPQLSDAQIAGVINHVLTAWGNDAYLPEDWQPIMPREVSNARGQNLTPTSMYELRQVLDVPVLVEEPAVVDEPVVAEPAIEIEEPVVEEAPLDTLEVEEPVEAAEPQPTPGPGEAPIDEEPAEEPIEEEPEEVAPPATLEPVSPVAVAAPLADEALVTTPAPRQDAVAAWVLTPRPVVVERAPAGILEGSVVESERALPQAPLGATPAPVQEAVVTWEAVTPETEVVTEAPIEPELAEAPEPAVPAAEEPVVEEAAEAPIAEEPVEVTAAEPLRIEEPVTVTPAPTAEAEALIARGQQVYSVACVRCHLADGQGRITIAPLRGSEVVQGDVRRLVGVPVSGHGNMPSLISLSDDDLAAVLSYVRTHFGNDAGIVTPEEVRQATAQSAR